MSATPAYLKSIRSFFDGPSLEERLEATRFRPSGFDYLRIVLALGVICTHSTLISYGDHHAGDTGLWSLLTVPRLCIVPLFFALSGFLVAGSLERSKTLFSFFGLRVLRIAPALAMEVLLSALVLGPLLTSLPLHQYFADRQFRAYLLNVVGDIHYSLPGVFQTTPFHQVNGQLWTIPFELVCYITIGGMAVLGVYKNNKALLCFIGLCYVGQVLNTIIHPNNSFNGVTGTPAVGSFIVGVAMYKFRAVIPWSPKLCLLSFLSIVLVVLTVKNGVRFIPLPAAYMACYLGLLNPRRNEIIASGDYSYGMYLYGFPLQQTVTALLPGYREWYFNLLFSLPLIIAVAVCSWWIVEKPTLALRKDLKLLEEKLLRWRSKQTLARPSFD
jgi:peptidoglycan/LPS O-acetylase OafA/YrhL